MAIKVYQIGYDLIAGENKDDVIRYFEQETGEKAENVKVYPLNEEISSIVNDMIHEGIQFPSWLGYTKE